MAAIAYLSDQNMLDYHRLNGNQKIVFWRVSTKKFSSFMVGDLLFFLAKGSENTRNNEKGITGYGVFEDEKQMSVDNMWKKYGTATGYINKEELESAILKTTRNKMPEKISCLLLKNVIFFQGPVYLSEVGIKLPSNLESFTYLDTSEGHITLELLEKIKEVGIDYWSAALNNVSVDTESFDREILRYQIATVYENGGIEPITHAHTYNKKCYTAKKHLNPEWINNKQHSFIVFGHPNTLYYIYSTSNRDSRENFITLTGQLSYLAYYLREKIDPNLEITVISKNQFTFEQASILYRQKIKIEY
ncbi:MAG: hypothetical protein II161_01200 [Erysipelotrichaceae bacterium]|nr:hypothetical protein [Erysipelotrichaceae bacterium]MBQ4253058.1 hypothetical protein [Erysipelotrichaceae bacterium]